jgi:hypothetical protein
LKWKVGFNTEVAEGTEKRSRDGRRLIAGVERGIPSQELAIKLRPYNGLWNCGLTGCVVAHISTSELIRKRNRLNAKGA